MKTFWLILLSLLIATPALARCDSGERIIRLGVSKQAETPARQRAIDSLRAAINLEMQGRACMRVVTDDSQFAGSLAITALQAGSVDMALPSFGELATFADEFKVFDLPFAFRDQSAVDRFIALAGERLTAPLRKFDVVPMGVWHSHFDQISAKQPVVIPANLAGLKIASGDRPHIAEMVTLLKGVNQNLDKTQTTEAVKDGSLEAQVTDWLALEQSKSATVHDGATATNHSYSGFQLLFGRAWWGDLPLRIKGPLRTLMPRINQQVNFDAAQRQVNARRSIIRSGAPVRALTNRQRREWLEVVKPVWDQAPNRELVDILRRANEAP